MSIYVYIHTPASGLWRVLFCLRYCPRSAGVQRAIIQGRAARGRERGAAGSRREAGVLLSRLRFVSSICLSCLLFSLVGFKGNLSLRFLFYIYFFSGASAHGSFPKLA